MFVTTSSELKIGFPALKDDVVYEAQLTIVQLKVTVTLNTGNIINIRGTVLQAKTFLVSFSDDVFL